MVVFFMIHKIYVRNFPVMGLVLDCSRKSQPTSLTDTGNGRKVFVKKTLSAYKSLERLALMGAIIAVVWKEEEMPVNIAAGFQASISRLDPASAWGNTLRQRSIVS
jgi:hypothetical protein